MKHLLTPLLGALTLSLSGCQDKPQPQFIRVENGRFVGGSANSGYFVGANFWYGALLATEGPGRDRDRLCRELDRLKASGIGNLRVLVGSEGNTGVISKVEPILQTAPGVYDDRALDGLPPASRHVLLLSQLHGLTYAQIGPRLGLAEVTVRRHMARAIAACCALDADLR